MKPWGDLYRAHRDARSLGSEAWVEALRQRLIVLSDAGHCDPSVRGRFTYKVDSAGGLEWSIRPRGGRAEPLRNLAALGAAQLPLTALVGRNHHLHRFTLALDGTRNDGSTWAIVVHLPDDRTSPKNPNGDRQGLGACSRAALHCHVGPDLDTGPKVRVPLPALDPVEALEWVLSQLVPTARFEPAPWPSVLDSIRKASP